MPVTKGARLIGHYDTNISFEAAQVHFHRLHVSKSEQVIETAVNRLRCKHLPT